MAQKRPAERIPWNDRLAVVHRQFPTTAERGPGWEEAMRDYDLMGSLIRDILKVESSPRRRGQRPSLDLEASEQRLRQLWGDDYTVLPFRDAFALLCGSRSRRAVADATGIAGVTVRRLTDGEIEPTGAELEQIAAAFGKPPTYFREYRTGLILGFLADYFSEVPDASVALAQHLSRRPPG